MTDYPGALDFIITDPAWVFTDALANIPSGDLTIVNHKTASGGYQTATQIAQFFQNDTANHKSAHFVVGRDGSVLQVVRLKDGAGANCCVQPGYNSYWNPLLAIVCSPVLVFYRDCASVQIAVPCQKWIPVGIVARLYAAVCAGAVF